jgi:hypothetical protein
VNLLPPGQIFGPRINQIDARFAKILNFSKKRLEVSVDFFNLTNDNTATGFQQNYGDGSGYLVPLTILNARAAKFNVTFDF